MKYKVQEHVENIKEFIIYQVAPNGEICKRIASCRDEKDANILVSLLNDKEAVKN